MVEEAKQEALREIKPLIVAAWKEELLAQALKQIENYQLGQPEQQEQQEQQEEQDMYIYCYCLTAEENLLHSKLESLNGIENQQVKAREIAGITAIVSLVPKSEYNQQTLEQRLADLTWLENKVQIHQDIIQKTREVTDSVIPLKFATIFSSLDSLTEYLQINSKHVAELLCYLTNKEEWGLKVFFSPDKWLIWREKQEEMTSSGNYLLHKKKIQEINDQAYEEVASLIDKIDEQLKEIVIDSVKNKLQDSQLWGKAEKMVFNGAYLVLPENVETLKKLIKEQERLHQDKGIAFMMSGPWPAYSFVN